MFSLYLLDNDAFTGYRGIGVDIAVEGDVEKPDDNVDVPGNRNVDRPEFRKDFGMATIQHSLDYLSKYLLNFKREHVTFTQYPCIGDCDNQDVKKKKEGGKTHGRYFLTILL